MANAAALIVAALVLRLQPEDHWPSALLAYLPPWLWLLPALVIGAGALIRSSGGLVAANMLALCFAALHLGGLGIATGSKPMSDDAVPVRVLTWNLHDEGEYAQAIRDTILGYRPDIVCVQEAWHKAFDEFLPGYQEASAVPVRTYIRGEIVRQDVLRVGDATYREWLTCEASVVGATVSTLNTHIQPWPANRNVLAVREELLSVVTQTVHRRARQYESIRQALPETGPVIVAGDFNTPPTSSLPRVLGGRLTDAFAATRFGFGMTYLLGKRLPAWRIDYILCGAGVRPVSCLHGPAHPSDHRPVIADLLVSVPR